MLNSKGFRLLPDRSIIKGCMDQKVLPISRTRNARLRLSATAGRAGGATCPPSSQTLIG